jgi:hypothetical protein
MNITNKENQQITYRTEISVQQWKSGLIKKEKFYYNQAALP